MFIDRDKLCRILEDESCGFAWTKYSAYKRKRLCFENGEGDFSVVEIPDEVLGELYPDCDHIPGYYLFQKDDSNLSLIKSLLKIWRSENA